MRVRGRSFLTFISRTMLVSAVVIPTVIRADQWLVDDVLTFSNLTAAITYELPSGGLQLKQIVSYSDNSINITSTDGDELTLTGGATLETAAIENRPLTASNAGLQFYVPVELVNDDANGGVCYLRAGGCTFYRSLSMPNSTQALEIRRVKASGIKFSGTSAIADLSRATNVTFGIIAKGSSGVTLTVEKQARVTLPPTILAKGSAFKVDGAGSRLDVRGEISMPDSMYYNGSTNKPVYTQITLSNGGELRCGRIVQARNNGSKIKMSGSSVLSADEGIEIHSTSGEAMVLSGGTVRTPDFNLLGSVAAQVSGPVTFDVSAITTQVGAVSFDPAGELSVTGGGMVEFTRGTEIPELKLGSGTTLKFGSVTPESPLLSLGHLTLPSEGKACLVIENRMFTGTARLATGITQEQLDALDVVMTPAATLKVIDGVLTFTIDGYDLSQPAVATWVDGGAPGDLSDPANWACVDVQGNPMPGALPTEATGLRVDGACSLSTSDFGFGRSLSLSGRITLTADCTWDLRMFDQIAYGTMVDLKGHTLRIVGFDGRFDAGISVTDSNSKDVTPGELQVEVPQGSFFICDKMLISGNLRLVKSGDGDWTIVHGKMTFSGGERIDGGRILRFLDGNVTYEAFGAVGDGTNDDLSALVAAHDMANRLRLPVRARDDATYLIGRGATTVAIRTDTDFGEAHFVIDDRDVEKHTVHIFEVKPEHESFAIEGVQALRRNQRNLGVTLPCRCLVYIENSDVKRYIRSGGAANNGASQHEVIVVDADGDIDMSAPIMWDYDRVTKATAYPIDEEPLTVKGGYFKTISNQYDADIYYARGLSVRRSNTHVENICHTFEESPTRAAKYNGFFVINTCADVTVSNCVLSGHRSYKFQRISADGTTTNTVNGGTYDTTATCAVRLRYVDCVQTNDINDTTLWGVHGSNYCKLMEYDHCRLSRFDAHQGVYNATVRNSTLGLKGFCPIGMGTLLIENSTLYANSLYSLRNDYGSHWDGELIVRNCVFKPRVWNKAAPVTLLSGTNAGTHDYGYDCKMPWRVTVDGLEIDDLKDASGQQTLKYDGPYIFADFNSKNTSADYVEKYPYTVTERVVLRNVTSKRPLQLSPNPWMFRNTVVITNAPDEDVQFSIGEQTAGWNWTNGTVKVDVKKIDSQVRNGRLVLTVTDVSGRVVYEQEKSVTSAGTVTFDYDLPVAGSRYECSVKAYDGDRSLAFATPDAEASLSAGSGEAPIVFSAAVVGGVSQVSNGVWRTAPDLNKRGDAYRISRPADFDVENVASEPVQIVDIVCPINDLVEPSRPPVDDAQGLVFAAFGEEDVGEWRALRPSIDGAKWVRLDGCRPVEGETYVARFEIDRSLVPPRVRYSVRKADEDAFTVLADADGETWHRAFFPEGQGVSSVGFDGYGEIRSFVGRKDDCAVAEVDGVRYNDFNEALAVGAAKGASVKLLIDLEFVPNGKSNTEVIVDVAGKKLHWQGGSKCMLISDGSTGKFRLVSFADGKLANGLSGYESYVLGVDAETSVRQPVLNFTREADGSVTLALAVNPPAGTGVSLTYELESSETPDFKTILENQKSSDPVFHLPAPEADARFYRMRVEFSDCGNSAR